MNVKCSACKGNGEVYIRIGTDVHIAKCVQCDGWGSHEAGKVVKTKAEKSFGKIDIDALLNE